MPKYQSKGPGIHPYQQPAVAYDKLPSLVTGTVYGEEAVAPYANGGGVYDCSFTGGLSTLEFDGARTLKFPECSRMQVLGTISQF